MRHFLYPISLKLFDGAAGTAAGTGTAAGAAGDQGETNSAVPGNTRRGKSGEFANVLFGKQAAQGVVTSGQEPSSDAGSTEKPDVQATSNTLEEKRKAYTDFVNGEYKDIHTQELQRIIDRRFRETKSLEKANAESKPIMDMLYQRYNLSDTESLQKALESDNAYWSEAADEAGMTVEQYKQFKRLERDNAELLRQQQQRQGEQRAEAQLQKWYQDAEVVRGKYPSFDLETEVQNQDFFAMLRSGVPMEHAYKVAHMDDIISDAMRTTAADTEQRVVANVRAKGARPAENGTTSQGAFTIKDDVSKLTAKDRAEAVRRAARGENISF